MIRAPFQIDFVGLTAVNCKHESGIQELLTQKEKKESYVFYIPHSSIL